MYTHVLWNYSWMILISSWKCMCFGTETRSYTEVVFPSILDIKAFDMCPCSLQDLPKVGLRLIQRFLEVYYITKIAVIRLSVWLMGFPRTRGAIYMGPWPVICCWHKHTILSKYNPAYGNSFCHFCSFRDAIFLVPPSRGPNLFGPP